MRKREKVLTPRLEIRELKGKIAVLKDLYRTGLRKELTPLQRRLSVLLAARALRRAENALVRSVERDQVNPQLELLSLPGPVDSGIGIRDPGLALTPGPEPLTPCPAEGLR